MNTANIKTLTAIAAVAFAATVPLASFAGEDARSVDSYNEGSEPVFMQPGQPNAPAQAQHAAPVSAKTSDNSQSIDPFYSPHAPMAQRAKAQAVNSTNEGQSTGNTD